MIENPFTTIVVVAALLVYFALAAIAGRSRATYNCPAPASSGHPEFDKRYRVQMNTLEQLALFLPAVALALPFLGDVVTAGIALLFPIGRVIYARAYYADPSKRTLGFMLTLLPSMLLMLAALVGAVLHLM